MRTADFELRVPRLALDEIFKNRPIHPHEGYLGMTLATVQDPVGPLVAGTLHPAITINWEAVK